MATKTKKKTATRRAKVDPFATQAAQEALLKFGPEESGLAELAQTAKDTYTTTVKQAQGTGASTIAAIDRARPAMQAIYDQAGGAQAATAKTLIGSDLAGLGPVAASIKAGAASEQATQLGNIQQARASALTDLLTRRVAATGGVQFATENARNQLAGDLGKVLTRKQQLAQEKGTFEQLTARELGQAAQELASKTELETAKLDQQERNSLRTSGTDPDTGGLTADAAITASRPKSSSRGGGSGTTGAGGVKLQTQQAQSRVASTIETIANRAHNVHATNPNLTRAQLVQYLSSDRPAKSPQRILDKTTGKPVLNPDGTPKTTSARAAVKGAAPDILMTAALDQTLYGYLSPNTQKKLQARGYSIRALGLTPYSERPKGADKRSAMVSAIDSVNRFLSTGPGGR